MCLDFPFDSSSPALQSLTAANSFSLVFLKIKWYLLFLPILTSCSCTQVTETETLSWGPQQSSYMAQQDRKGKHIRTSGFPLLLLRFALRKQAHVRQLDRPEPGMPSDRSLLPRGKMAFGKHLNFGALKHQRSTPLLVEVTHYTGTHSSMICERVPTAGILLPPWRSRQLKCWFDA